MKKGRVVLGALVLLIGWTGSAVADSATKEECVAKSQEAAQLILTKGEDAAFAEINEPEGKFKWKDTYVFVIGLDGTVLARPVWQQFIGTNQLGWQDASNPPKHPVEDMAELAQNAGEGWVTYLHSRPGEPQPSKKVSYVYRVPGKDFFVGAGAYE